MSGISLATGSQVLLQGGLKAQSSSDEKPEEMRLKQLISKTESRLEKLKKQDSEYEKLEARLEGYKNQLSEAEKGEGSALSESEQKRKYDSFEKGECQTCKNRKYVDVSDDEGVSFQSPTHVSPAAAGSAVRAHENQHVTRNKAAAERNGQKIVTQTVTIHTAICPECGKSYVSGGVTKTVTKADTTQDYDVGKADKTPDGANLDTVA